MRHIPVKEILPDGTTRTYSTPESVKAYKEMSGLDLELKYTDTPSEEVWSLYEKLLVPKLTEEKQQ